MKQFCLLLMVFAVGFGDSEECTSSLRTSQVRTKPVARVALPQSRPFIVVYEDFEENIVSQLMLSVYATTNAIQRNVNWHIEDIVEYSRRLVGVLEKKNKMDADICQNQASEQRQIKLPKDDAQTSARLQMLQGMSELLTNLGITVNLQKQMLVLAGQIEARAKLRINTKEIQTLEAKLQIISAEVTANVRGFIASAPDEQDIRDAYAKFDELESRISPVDSLVAAFQCGRKDTISNITLLRQRVQQTYMNDMQSRKKKLAGLYNQNQQSLESIVATYQIAKGRLGDSQNGKLHELLSSCERQNKLVDELMKGFLWQQRSLVSELMKGEKLQALLQELVADHRKNLTADYMVHSEILYEAKKFLDKAVVSGSSSSAWAQQFEQQLNLYNRTILELQDKLKFVLNTVNSSKTEAVLKINAKLTEDVFLQLRRLREGLKNHALTAEENKQLQTLGGLLKSRINATNIVITQLDNSIVTHEEKSVTETLRRKLQRIHIEQNESEIARRKIFGAPSKVVLRSTSQKSPPAAPPKPLIMESDFSCQVSHLRR